MEPITLIVAALAAGASAGAIDALKDNAKETAKAAYAKLCGLARKRVAGRPDGELALERHEAAPQKWEAVLTDELTAAGAASDAELVTAAKAHSVLRSFSDPACYVAILCQRLANRMTG